MTSAEIMDKVERIYEVRLRADLERTQMNSFVAIEPESGDYFLGPTLSEASAAARLVHPNRRCGIVRVGHEAALHMGALQV